MEYRLNPKVREYARGIAVIGCGGTGAYVAEGLCRLLVRNPQFEVQLIDGDRVEERNLGRQNFYPEDLGRYKAQALAERLARKYGRPIAYSNQPFGLSKPSITMDWAGGSPLTHTFLVIGCVDNAPARAAIAKYISTSQWWLDAGNGREFGQVVIGNAARGELAGAFDPQAGQCHALPLPTLVRPELLVPAAPEDPSCSQAAAAGDQGPTINMFMAALVVEMVRRLLEERLIWWQVYLDLTTGTFNAIPCTPEGVHKLTRASLRSLERKVVNWHGRS